MTAPPRRRSFAPDMPPCAKCSMPTTPPTAYGVTGTMPPCAKLKLTLPISPTLTSMWRNDVILLKPPIRPLITEITALIAFSMISPISCHTLLAVDLIEFQQSLRAFLMPEMNESALSRTALQNLFHRSLMPFQIVDAVDLTAFHAAFHAVLKAFMNVL